MAAVQDWKSFCRCLLHFLNQIEIVSKNIPKLKLLVLTCITDGGCRVDAPQAGASMEVFYSYEGVVFPLMPGCHSFLEVDKKSDYLWSIFNQLSFIMSLTNTQTL